MVFLMNTDIYYNTFKQILAAPLFSLYHIKAKGKENLPDSSAVLISNHITYLDPIFIIAAANPKKPIHFVTKPLKGFNSFYRFSGQLSFGDKLAKGYYEKAKEILDNGRYLGVFPEGKRSLTGELGHFNNGASSIAIRT